MARYALIFGILLIALGLVAYQLAEASSKTALIPSYVGAVFVVLAAIAKIGPGVNKHVMHVAALLGLLGTVGGLGMGVPNIIKYFGGNKDVWLKALTQGGMGILCAIFLVLCIRSFIAARKARLA